MHAAELEEQTRQWEVCPVSIAHIETVPTHMLQFLTQEEDKLRTAAAQREEAAQRALKQQVRHGLAPSASSGKQLLTSPGSVTSMNRRR